MGIKQFGQRIKQLRAQKKLSQSQLAKLIGTHYVVIGRYETGKALPSVEQLAALADGLNVTVDWLLFGDRPARHLGDAELLYLFEKLLTLSPKDRIDAKTLLGDFVEARSAPKTLDQPIANQ